MKIEHEIAGVEVVRLETLGEALASGLNERIPGRFLDAALQTFRLGKHSSLEEFLGNVLYEKDLRKPYEEGETYTRTLALASIEKEKTESELSALLETAGYFPASISEGMAYFRRAKNVILGTVIHLATRILDDNLREWRIITHGRDKAELVQFYPETKLRLHYRLVVVKKEKPVQKK